VKVQLIKTLEKKIADLETALKARETEIADRENKIINLELQSEFPQLDISLVKGNNRDEIRANAQKLLEKMQPKKEEMVFPAGEGGPALPKPSEIETLEKQKQEAIRTGNSELVADLTLQINKLRAAAAKAKK